MSEEISTEINAGMQTKESVCSRVERKANEVVNNVRRNVDPKKVALAAVGGLIFFSTACGSGHPPEVSSVPLVPSTPTMEVLLGTQDQADITSATINQDQNLQVQEEDFETRKAKEVVEEWKKQVEALKINETPKGISPKSAIIDYQFLADNPQINMIKTPMDEEALLRFMLKDAYVSRKQLEAEFGSDFWDKKDALEKIGGEYSKEVAAAYGFLQRYHNHGERVGDTEEKTLEIFGFKRSSIDFFPLQNSLSPEEIQVHKDELGNVGYLINIKPESVINAVRDIKDNHPEITRFNLSIHIGPQGFYYEEKERIYEVIEPRYQTNFDENGNELYFPGAEISDDRVTTPNGIRIRSSTGEFIEPLTAEEWEVYKTKNTKITVKERDLGIPDIKEEDAYTPDKAKDNLPKIFQVANAFSDDLFFAAAGNNIDDLRGLKDTQPKNLIFFAQWNSQYKSPHGKIDGADIYVDNYFLGHDAGSSFSTPTLSAAADILESRGYNNEQIKKKLFESCDEVSYERYDEKTGKTFTYSANLFKPQKFKSIVGTITEESKK